MLLNNLLLLMIASNLIYLASGSSIGFVIDNTFSMRKNINKVKDTITEISDTHSDFVFINKYIFVKFNEMEYLTKSKTYDQRYLFDVALNTINGKEVNLDCAEPALYAVMHALKRISELNTNIYVFTDAPAKDFYRQNEVIKLCQGSKSQITFIVTGTCIQDPREFWMYNAIVRNCSGNVLVISGDELDQVPMYVRETLKGNPKVLVKTEVPPNQPTDVEFQITSKTNYVIISASGRNVHITSRARSQARVMWTDNFKVLKIMNPTIGEHIVLVSGESISIDVNILSVDDNFIKFENTTSNAIVEARELKSTQLTESTSTKPKEFTSIKSTESTSINPMESTFINPTEATFINPTEFTSIKSTESTSINPMESPFINPTEATFINPTEFTSIKSTKSTFTNPTESTSIPQPEAFISPVVDISEGYKVEVPLSGTKLLTCKVTGIPKPDIIWTDGNENTLPSKTISLDAPYLHVSFLRISNVTDNNFYACKASNTLGNDTKYIEVALKDRPLISLDYGKDSSGLMYKVNEGKQIVDWCENEKLYCSEDSELQYEWLFNGNPVNHTENSLEISNAGDYTCKATNLDGILQIDFTVVATNCCIVNIGKNVNHYTPFIVDENLTFLETKRLGKILRTPSNGTLKLICHNPYAKVSPFYKNDVTVKCEHQNIFNCDGVQYTFEDINCNNEVYPVIKSVDLIDEVKLTEVGFISETKFVKIYNVYIDAMNGYIMAQYNPVMTRKDNFKGLHWFDHPNFDKEIIPGVYTCHNDSSICCYAKRQLVSANDVAYGATQTSTFVNSLNSVPFWRTCHGSSETALNNFEQIMKSTYNTNTTVWSGASDYISVFDGYVPQYLWKVVKVDDTNELFYVYINVEGEESYPIKCIENSHSNSVPDELKHRLYICNMTEMTEIINIPLSTFIRE